MAYKVVKKNVLNPQIFLMEVEAPLVAKKAEKQSKIKDGHKAENRLATKD